MSLGDFVCLIARIFFLVFVGNVFYELVIFSGVPCHVTLSCTYFQLGYGTHLHTGTHAMQHPSLTFVKMKNEKIIILHEDVVRHK